MMLCDGQGQTQHQSQKRKNKWQKVSVTRLCSGPGRTSPETRQRQFKVNPSSGAGCKESQQHGQGLALRLPTSHGSPRKQTGGRSADLISGTAACDATGAFRLAAIPAGE